VGLDPGVGVGLRSLDGGEGNGGAGIHTDTVVVGEVRLLVADGIGLLLGLEAGRLGAVETDDDGSDNEGTADADNNTNDDLGLVVIVLLHGGGGEGVRAGGATSASAGRVVHGGDSGGASIGESITALEDGGGALDVVDDLLPCGVDGGHISKGSEAETRDEAVEIGTAADGHDDGASGVVHHLDR